MDIKTEIEAATGEPVAIAAFTEAETPTLPFIVITPTRETQGSDIKPSELMAHSYTIERYTESPDESAALTAWLDNLGADYTYSISFVSSDEMFEQIYELTIYEN